MALTRAEKETVLQMDEESKQWIAYTTSSSMMNLFEKRGWEEIKNERQYCKGELISKVYTAPKRFITVRSTS